MFDERVGFRGAVFLVCWSLGHGYHLSVDVGGELVKKCNTF